MSKSILFITLLCCVLYNASSNNIQKLKGSKKFKTDPDGSPFPPFKGCINETGSRPIRWSNIPTFTINLDLPPEERWTEVVKFKKNEMNGLLSSIKNNTNSLFGVKVFELVDNYMPWLAKSLPREYYRELIGISKAVDIPIGEITLFNVFYEFFSVCTSIIIQGDDGHMFHGRNLDFGLFLGWDPANHTWLTTEYLQKLLVKLKFEKNNSTVYSSINFAGYIGILTAVKKNAFSLTINERFTLNGGYVGLAEWILGHKGLKWMGLFTRDVMLEAVSYTSAQKLLVNEPLIAPVYFILTGNKSHQGCIITRGRNDFDVWSLGGHHKGQSGSWYLVQTNYDHWKVPPFYDNRRTPAVTCMEEMGSGDPIRTLKNVLSTRPVLNKLTTYSAIMEIQTGKMYILLQNCASPCWPW